MLYRNGDIWMSLLNKRFAWSIPWLESGEQKCCDNRFPQTLRVPALGPCEEKTVPMLELCSLGVWGKGWCPQPEGRRGGPKTQSSTIAKQSLSWEVVLGRHWCICISLGRSEVSTWEVCCAFVISLGRTPQRWRTYQNSTKFYQPAFFAFLSEFCIHCGP